MSNLDRGPPPHELGGLAATSAGPALDLLPGKEVLLGESTRVRRLLPTLGRRLVGRLGVRRPLRPGRRRDAAGHAGARRIRTPGCRRSPGCSRARCTTATPWAATSHSARGELALMTAGHGIAHAEQSPAEHPRFLHGAQLWVALPDARPGDRAGVRAPRRRCPASPPTALTATVLMGSLRRRDVAGDGVHAAGRRRPRPGRRCGRRAAAGAGLRVRACWPPPAPSTSRARRWTPGAMLYLGTGRRTVRLRTDAAGAAAAARRRAVRGADRHVVELRRPVRRGDRRVRRARGPRGRPVRRRRRLRRRPAGPPRRCRRSPSSPAAASAERGLLAPKAPVLRACYGRLRARSGVAEGVPGGAAAGLLVGVGHRQRGEQPLRVRVLRRAQHLARRSPPRPACPGTARRSGRRAGRRRRGRG